MGDAPKCWMENVLDAIGGKWKVYLLWQLRERSMRFSELRRALPRVTQKVLTAQLRELEQDGLITRTVFAEVPPRVEYALTEDGRSLEPVMQALHDWGAAHMPRLLERRLARSA